MKTTMRISAVIIAMTLAACAGETDDEGDAPPAKLEVQAEREKAPEVVAPTAGGVQAKGLSSIPLGTGNKK